MDKAALAGKLKAWAAELGFDAVGISRAAYLEEEAPRLERWLKADMHGQMAYMANHFDLRLDPRKLVPGAKSVVSLAFNYFPAETQRPDAPQIAKYAYGEDYHFVLKRKLKALLAKLREAVGDVNGRAFTDSAPVLERPWAARSGLGWVGKHSLLLTRQRGSFFFLAELITDVDLEPDGPVTDHCGTCTRCMDACPTGAIPQPYMVDGSKCISYFTIELKDALPPGYEDQFENWMFGCDICQDVCPWNRFSRPHAEPGFEPDDRLLRFREREWREITRDVFGEIFRRSAVKRTGYEGLKRNLAYLARKSDPPASETGN